MHSNFGPGLQNALHLIITIVFILTTCLVIIVIYLIINKSGPIKKYRYYMLQNVICCFIFLCAEFITNPVFLFPSFCMVFEPIIPLPAIFNIGGIYVFTILIINMNVSVGFSLFYRYSQVSI